MDDHAQWCADHPREAVGCVSRTVAADSLFAFLSRDEGGVTSLVISGEATLPVQRAREFSADVAALIRSCPSTGSCGR